jgi:RAD51-like protein 3
MCVHEARLPNTNFRMRLASFVPSIPIDVVAHLENSGFRTDADVLFTPAFDIFTALPPKTLSLQDVAELISRVEELASAAAVPANDLLLMDNLARGQDFDLSTGDPLLDANLLGLGGRIVIEISGDRGSGKTVHFVEIV